MNFPGIIDGNCFKLTSGELKVSGLCFCFVYSDSKIVSFTVGLHGFLNGGFFHFDLILISIKIKYALLKKQILFVIAINRSPTSPESTPTFEDMFSFKLMACQST